MDDPFKEQAQEFYKDLQVNTFKSWLKATLFGLAGVLSGIESRIVQDRSKPLHVIAGIGLAGLLGYCGQGFMRGEAERDFLAQNPGIEN